MVWRGARSSVDRDSLKMDHGCRLHPPDQLSEDAIDGSYLGFSEVIDIGQEQVRHLPQNFGIVLGSILFGAVQFCAQIRRYGRHD